MGRKVVAAAAVVLTALSATGCYKYEYVRRSSSCTTDEECPPSSVCRSNTCVKDLAGVQATVVGPATRYGTYVLPGGETDLAVAVSGPPDDAKTKIVLDLLSAEVARYERLRRVFAADLTGQASVSPGTADEFDRLASVLGTMSSSRPLPSHVLRAVFYYVEEAAGPAPNLTLQLVSLRERRVLSSITKSFFSAEHIRATVSPLVEEVFEKELDKRRE